MELAPKFLYTRREAASVLGYSLSSIQELMHRGLLKGIRKGQRLMIHRDELERFSRCETPVIWGPKREGKTVRVHAGQPA
jgi:excisionase family DNA binding protein